MTRSRSSLLVFVLLVFAIFGSLSCDDVQVNIPQDTQPWPLYDSNTNQEGIPGEGIIIPDYSTEGIPYSDAIAPNCSGQGCFSRPRGIDEGWRFAF